MRFAAISHRTAQSFFGAWRLLVVELRAHLHLALEHRRKRVLGLALSSWVKATEELHKVGGGGHRTGEGCVQFYVCAAGLTGTQTFLQYPESLPSLCSVPVTPCLPFTCAFQGASLTGHIPVT